MISSETGRNCQGKFCKQPCEITGILSLTKSPVKNYIIFINIFETVIQLYMSNYYVQLFLEKEFREAKIVILAYPEDYKRIIRGWAL
jgi:hypothetical protein